MAPWPAEVLYAAPLRIANLAEMIAKAKTPILQSGPVALKSAFAFDS